MKKQLLKIKNSNTRRDKHFIIYEDNKDKEF